MKDILGREITPGCYIVYPGRQGSSIWMSMAQVKEITHRHKYFGDVPVLKVQPIHLSTRRSLGRPTTISRIDVVTVVELTNVTTA